jgi:FMN-dependent NADH-azoreductase
MNILMINAHPDYKNALRGTNQLADFTLKQIKQQIPDAQVENLALYAPETTIPEITAENLNDPSLIDAQQNELIAQFKRADLIMIFMPLHNFNIVSRLKDYIDNILIANKTFKYTADGSVGLLDGKQKVAYVQTSGSDYEHDIRYVNADIAPHYMRTILNFMGISKMELIRAEGLDLIENDKQAILENSKQTLATYIQNVANA